MMNQAVQDAMNEQIKNELYSAYLYLSMAAYFEAEDFQGFAHWMRAQAEEEQAHAMKFFDFINERGGRVTLHAIEQPPTTWTSPLDVFETTLEHEETVTSLIHKLYALSLEENDYASQVFLQWFVDEQVEEEANANQIVAQLKMVDGKAQGLLMLDRALGQRG
jgi:ferritin